MKKINNNANATIKRIVACTAKATAFKTLFFLFFVGLTLMFTSCAQNATGCGTWACKSNAKYINEHKYAKYTSNMYKCPSNQKYSR